MNNIRDILCAAAIVVLAQCAPRSIAQSPMTTVYVVRHAEKLDPTDRDSPLSPEGEARARSLAERLDGAGVTRIYATTLVRTQQTVAPLARARGIDPVVLDPFALDSLVARIRTMDHGQVVLVAGHNNTVPGIVQRLTGQPVDGIPEEVYDRLYKVMIAPDGKATLEQMTYGEAGR
ncbi:MAG: histidine phosphatase family protein [Flavobacteriales bacterium]|nr:histidine phosphatase family protein [Flavobacteriales bacterium]